MKFWYVINVLDLQILDNETTEISQNFTEMNFVSLFFLNERNITTSLFMKYLKCTVVYYANQTPFSSRI